MDRRTAACVAAELMLYPTYKIMVEEGIEEAAQRARVWFSDASIRRYGAYDVVFEAVSALEENERYQRAVACVQAIERALARMPQRERWFTELFYFRNYPLHELDISRRTYFRLRRRVLMVVYEELRAAGVSPFADDEMLDTAGTIVVK